MSYCTYYFDSEISQESISQAITDIENNLCKINTSAEDSCDLRLYFNTEGGSVCAAFVFAEFLVRLGLAGINVEITITEICHSSGLLFLLYMKEACQKCQCNVKLRIFKYTYAIFHKVGLSLHTTENAVIFDRILEQTSERQNLLLKRFKKYMTPDEIKSFNKGEDTCFFYERLSEIFNAQIVEII